MRSILLFILALGISQNLWAYKNSTFYLGGGYYAQNSLARTTVAENGAGAALGQASLPLAIKYDWQMGFDLFFSPQIVSSLLYPRTSVDSAAKISFTHLVLPVGRTFQSSNFEWSMGPGLMSYEFKGAGGSKILNNGTSTQSFGLPGRTVTSRTVTFNLGLAYNNLGRWGMDVIVEDAISNTKRAESLFFSYLYAFGGR